MILLPDPDNFIQFFRMDFSDVLDHHCDIFGIVFSCEFFIIRSILEHNGFT